MVDDRGIGEVGGRQPHADIDLIGRVLRGTGDTDAEPRHRLRSERETAVGHDRRGRRPGDAAADVRDLERHDHRNLGAATGRDVDRAGGITGEQGTGA